MTPGPSQATAAGYGPSPAAAPPAAPTPDFPAHASGAGETARLEILRRCEALEVPWQRILLDELQSERTLRRYAADVAGMPLASRLSLLSFSFLKSWRVRDEIEALSSAARSAALRSAIRQLRLILRRLLGQEEPARAAFAGHLWFAYERVLLLQRVCRAARRSRGSTAERMASVCSTTRCGFDDAAWAVGREDAPRPGHRLDAAIRKVREEGFQIPRAATEARSFAELRRVVRASPRPVRRRRLDRRGDSALLPNRVPLSADAL